MELKWNAASVAGTIGNNSLRNPVSEALSAQAYIKRKQLVFMLCKRSSVCKKRKKKSMTKKGEKLNCR